MVKSRQVLKDFIRLLVESKFKEAYLSGGEKTPWGSDAHIKYLEEQIAEISNRKQRERKGSVRRHEWAVVESRLKQELKSARHAADKNRNIINEKEE